MKRSNAAVAAVVAIVVIVGVLGLRYRPVLPSAVRPLASAAQPPREPAFPPENVDGRIEMPAAARTVDLCGYGPFEPAPGRLYPPHLSAAADLALAQASAAMADSGTPRQRVAGRYWQALSASQRTRDGYLAQHPACEQDTECRRQLDAAAWRSYSQAREAMVAEAMTSRDAPAYALAFYACLNARLDEPSSGSCRLVSAAQWAQLDTDNAMAWVHAAWELHARGDAVGRAEAMRRAAQASRSRTHEDVMLEPLGHAQVRNLEPTTRSIAQTTAMGIRAAMPLPGLLVLHDECLSKEPLDDARRTTCNALGRTLAERSLSLMEMGFGIRLGERAGWPEEEVRALRERLGAAHAVLTEEQRPWTCNYQRQLDQYTAAALDGSGELAIAERLAGTSGRTLAQLAQERRMPSLPQPPVRR